MKENKGAMIIGASIIIAVVIHAFATRYGTVNGRILDRWTGYTYGSMRSK